MGILLLYPVFVVNYTGRGLDVFITISGANGSVEQIFSWSASIPPITDVFTPDSMIEVINVPTSLLTFAIIKLYLLSAGFVFVFTIFSATNNESVVDLVIV